MDIAEKEIFDLRKEGKFIETAIGKIIRNKINQLKEQQAMKDAETQARAKEISALVKLEDNVESEFMKALKIRYAKKHPKAGKTPKMSVNIDREDQEDNKSISDSEGSIHQKEDQQDKCEEELGKSNTFGELQNEAEENSDDTKSITHSESSIHGNEKQKYKLENLKILQIREKHAAKIRDKLIEVLEKQANEVEAHGIGRLKKELNIAGIKDQNPTKQKLQLMKDEQKVQEKQAREIAEEIDTLEKELAERALEVNNALQRDKVIKAKILKKERKLFSMAIHHNQVFNKNGAETDINEITLIEKERDSLPKERDSEKEMSEMRKKEKYFETQIGKTIRTKLNNLKEQQAVKHAETQARAKEISALESEMDEKVESELMKTLKMRLLKKQIQKAVKLSASNITQGDINKEVKRNNDGELHNEEEKNDDTSSITYSKNSIPDTEQQINNCKEEHERCSTDGELYHEKEDKRNNIKSITHSKNSIQGRIEGLLKL